MNPMDLLKNMGMLQEKMQEAQQRMRSLTVTGSAGAGMVEITMNGEFQILSVNIAPEVVDPADITMLQDLILAAHNDAAGRVRDQLRESLPMDLMG